MKPRPTFENSGTHQDPFVGLQFIVADPTRILSPNLRQPILVVECAFGRNDVIVIYGLGQIQSQGIGTSACTDFHGSFLLQLFPRRVLNAGLRNEKVYTSLHKPNQP